MNSSFIALKMDDTNQYATLDLTGEKSDESPSSGSDIVGFANRRSTQRATKTKDILILMIQRCFQWPKSARMDQRNKAGRKEL